MDSQLSALDSQLHVTASGQIDAALGGLGIAAVEERGVPNCADAHAAAFVGDLRAKRGALFAFGAEKAELHEFVRAELFLQFAEKRRREPAFAELQCRFELLAEATKKRFLRASEWEFVHFNHGLHGWARIGIQ